MNAFKKWYSQWTACDRRQWLQAVVPILIGTKNQAALAQVLSNDDVLTEKQKAQDVYVVIREFLAAYAVVSQHSTESNRILRGFLTFLFRCDLQQRLRVDDIAVWLQPLNDSTLLADAVAEATFGAWVPPQCDPVAWKCFTLICRRIGASLERRGQQIQAAFEQLRSLKRLWLADNSLPDVVKMKELAAVEYELGYAAFLAGRIREAQAYFAQSAAHARVVGDAVGERIGKFNRTYTQYLGRKLDTTSARQEFSAIRAEMERVGLGQLKATGWLCNIDLAMFELALDDHNAKEAQALSKLILASESFLRSQHQLSYQIIKEKLLGRLALTLGRYRSALRHLGTFLPVDLSGLAKPDPNLTAICNGEQEISVAYRDAGLALLHHGSTPLARKVWKAGLQCPIDLGNRFFKRDIRRLLRQHRPEKV